MTRSEDLSIMALGTSSRDSRADPGDEELSKRTRRVQQVDVVKQV